MKRYKTVNILALFILFKAMFFAATLDVTIKNISDNTDFNKLDFGTIDTENFKLAGQYIRINYEGFNGPWKIDIYTKNDDYKGSGSQVGGLLSSDKKYRAPLLWIVSSSTENITNLGFSEESVKNTISGSSTSINVMWTWVKDKNDSDWLKARNEGYTTIAYGGADYSNLAYGLATDKPLYLYLEGYFQSSPGELSYDTTVWFDIYPIDTIEPIIVHTPINEINMIGNKLVIEADITDNAQYTTIAEVKSCKFIYRIDDGDWNINFMKLTGENKNNKHAYFELSPSSITGRNKLEYYLMAEDGAENITLWRSSTIPHTISLSIKQSFNNVLFGKFYVQDGNPYDGQTGVEIPDGALENPIDLQITQISAKNAPEGTRGVGVDKPLIAFSFSPSPLKFKKPIKLTILYLDLNDNGYVELEDGTDTTTLENELKILWWDMFKQEWVILGGVIDVVKNTITVETDHFSIFAVFPVGKLTMDSYRPLEKIITPNGDGKNDEAVFQNLSSSNYEIKIYDITGRRIRTINKNNSSSAIWDGRDELGNIVESGVYIYQFKAEVDGQLKLISGTITVAK